MIERTALTQLGARIIELASLTQLGAQGQHQIEHDADAGEVFARKAAARLVRVDDAFGGRQFGAR